MSLATRCPACGTVFRVVQDQLKVSEGWVRCGRCADVFNALEGLFDLERDGVPTSTAGPSGEQAQRVLGELARHSGFGALQWKDDAPPHDDGASMAQHATVDEAPIDAAPGATQADIPLTVSPPAAPAARRDAGDERKPPPPKQEALSEVAAPVEDEPEDDAAVVFDEYTRFDRPARARSAPDERTPHKPAAPEHAPPGGTEAQSTQADSTQADSTQVDSTRSEPLAEPSGLHGDDPTPSFLADAEAAERWKRPKRRVGVLLACALLTVLLALQLALASRDSLAAHVPATQPALQALCDIAGCKLEPLRRIEHLAVDASGLTRIEGSPMYRLSVTLRSRAEVPLQMPWIDLTLTDTQGELIARRAIQPAELGARSNVILAQQELPMQALLNMGERRVAGYTVEIFYP